MGRLAQSDTDCQYPKAEVPDSNEMISPMTNHECALPQDLAEAFSRFVEAQAGLHFPRERLPDLGRALQALAREIGCDGAEPCARLLMSEGAKKEVVDLFISYITVGETYFFRDKAACDALEARVLPELIGARRKSSKRLRIWSAGCCTGEEAYSIAIAVSRALPDIRDWNVTILGTDINSRFLQKAETGIYSDWSFRGTPDAIKERYFHRLPNGCLEVIPSIKGLVSFGGMNLVEDACPTLLHKTNAMDVIFCRNVLMYFSLNQAKKVAGKLYRSLVTDGWLFPGGSEALRELFGQFAASNLSGAIIYRKNPAPEEPPRLIARAGHRLERESPRQARKNAKSDTAPSTVETAKASSQNSEALAEHARRLANEGRLDEALAACDEAVRADKLTASLHYLRGLVLDESGAPEDAEAALKRALFLDCNFVLAHFALGNLMRRQARWRPAKRYFKNTRDLLRECDPDSAIPESGGITARRLLAILDSTHDSIAIV